MTSLKNNNVNAALTRPERCYCMKKKIIITAVSALGVLFLLTFAAAWYMLDYALTPATDARDMAKRYSRMFSEYPYMRHWVDSMKSAGALRDTFVIMPDGERQHAVYARADSAVLSTAVLVHGYKDSHINMLPIAKVYADMGYNILLPDLHAHGLSEGSAIQMGWKDREDVLRWLGIADSLFATAGGRPRIVLHGVSMGAATVMNVAGEDYPASVKCFVEDCGYTSVWDEFSRQLADQFGLSPFPVLYAASALCKLRYGWSFGEASPVAQLAKKDTPMLFIHGSSDDYVPSAMVFPLYNANPSYSSSSDSSKHFNGIWITPGCAHAMSFHDYPQDYAARVGAFVGRIIGE